MTYRPCAIIYLSATSLFVSSSDRLRRPCDAFDCPTKCGLPATILFYVDEEIIVPRCSLHADDFRIALRDILRPTVWRERRIVAAAS